MFTLTCIDADGDMCTIQIKKKLNELHTFIGLVTTILWNGHKTQQRLERMFSNVQGMPLVSAKGVYMTLTTRSHKCAILCNMTLTGFLQELACDPPPPGETGQGGGGVNPCCLGGHHCST